MNDELMNTNDKQLSGEELEKKKLSVTGDKAVSEDVKASAGQIVKDEDIPVLKPIKKRRVLEKGTAAYEVFDWIRTVCIGILAGVFIVVFLVQKDNVYGDSMLPTLSSGDVVFTQKVSTYFKSYKRGDIVVLDGANMEGYYGKEYLIKRVVGLPGETVKIEDGSVYIKAAGATEFYQLVENYLPAGTKTTMMETGKKKGYNEITLGENEYYCLGDNRPVSNDSRNLGPFTADRIKAVAVIKVYPVNEIKILT